MAPGLRTEAEASTGGPEALGSRVEAQGASGGGAGLPRLEATDAEALLTRLEAALRAGRRAHSRADGLALCSVAVQAARGTGPLEVALGEGLDALLRREGLAPLGRSGVGDVGREDLGLTDGYARRLRRNAEKLRQRPVLRAAILAGEVTSRKAEVVLERTPAVEDAYWTARARADTVRRLEAATQAGAEENSEDWYRLEVALPRGQQDTVRTALEWARILEGGATPRLRQVEVLLMEFLGGYPVPVGEGPAWGVARCAPRPTGAGAADVGGEGPGAAPDEGPVPPAASAAEVGREGPGAAPDEAPVPPVASAAEVGGEVRAWGPSPDEGPFDAQATLAGLQALVRARAATDEWLRRACLLVKELGAHRWMGFRTFGAWCTEALGLSPRTVRQLMALERRLQALPPLRQAVRDGTLTLEKARQVARHATAADVGRRIAEAAARPAIQTQRREDAEADRRMWDASCLRLSLPARVERLFHDALRAGREYFPGKTPGEVVVCIAAHCLLTWRPEVKRLLRAAGEALLRDDWLCQVPGCSHAAQHLHHLQYKSRGGPDAEWNLLGLCVAHHLQGVHQGHIEVSGRAPDELTFLVGAEAVHLARVALWGQGGLVRTAA